MNQPELENQIQLKSDKYVLDLEERYGQSEFKNTVIAFLKSKPHKLLLLESSDTSASAWKLLQVLMELQCVSNHMVSNDYLGSQNRTTIKWGEISESLQSFGAVSKLKNLTICEFDESVKFFDENLIDRMSDESVEWFDKKLINTIIERISYNVNKKIIFIISSKDKVFFKKVKSDSSIYFNESKNTVMPLYDFNIKSLIERASVGDVSAVKDILDNGVDVNGMLDGTTALHEAANNGFRDIALALLSNGANHQLRGGCYTPLQCAVSNSHEDVVKLFLESGVDVNSEGFEGLTALHYATHIGHRDLVLTLLKHGAKNLQDYYKETPLHYAAANGHNDIVELFLDNGVDVNTKGNYGMTALHYAVREGYKDVIVTLVKKGADINIKDDNGKTFLDLAQNEKGIIKLLLKEEGKRKN